MKRWNPWIPAIAFAAVLLAATAVAGEAAPKGKRPAIAMTPSQLLGIKQLLAVLVVGLSGFGVAALTLAASALAPERVTRAEQALQRGQWRVVLVGVLTTVLLIVAAALIGQMGQKGGVPVLGMVVLLPLGFLAWLALFGLAATASLMGRNLLGGEASAAGKRVGLGGLAVGGSRLVPSFGWAGFLYLVLRGTGAATVALFASSRPSEDAAA